MTHNRSKILLISMMSLNLLSCVNIFCTTTTDAVYIGTGSISSITGALVGFCAAKTIGSHNIASAIGALTGAALGASLIRGIYNVRAHNAMLQEIEIKYGLTPAYDWYQLPGHYATQLVCYGSDAKKVEQCSPCIQFVKANVMPDHITFDFTEFVKALHHVPDFNKKYCIAKSYFDIFNCATLSDLKSTIASSMQTMKKDFELLMKLTELSNSHTMALTLKDFNNFQQLLNQGHQHVIINSYLGAFGYSPLQNGQRVKKCMIQLVKYHAYLSALTQLLLLCSDGSDTLLINSSGDLHFTLRDIDCIQEVRMR